MILFNHIFFDEKYFEESGLIFWIYDNGVTEFTNERIHRTKVTGITKRETKNANYSSKFENAQEKKF